MNIVERARQFVESGKRLLRRDAWDWRRCPHCGSSDTCRYGYYPRRPWTLEGRQELRVQRHQCHSCGRTYAEESAQVRRSHRYGRDVQRLSLDFYLHGGTSLRRSVEFVRSIIARQERYCIWHPLAPQLPGPLCRLSSSSLWRWLERAGRQAKETVPGQLAGAQVETVAADGLWARLRGGSRRVVAMVVDSVSGLIYPPLVGMGEESQRLWQGMFERASQAGLELDRLRGVTSDWAGGLVSYLREHLPWLHHQCCLWHFWRGRIRPYLASVAQDARGQVRALVLALMQAPSYEEAEVLLVRLAAQSLAEGLAAAINDQFDHLFVHLLDYCRGLSAVAPEWYWRDYRLRLSHGRNHGSDECLERAALVWAIYRNFEPAQRRSERKRTYRHPGKSPLEVVGLSPGNLSYLDALAV